MSIAVTKRTTCFTFVALLGFSSNVSLHKPIFFMRYSLRSRDNGLVFKSAGFSFVEILSTRNHLFRIACWLHIILVDKCFARPGPRRLKKPCVLVESSLSHIWTLELLLKPPLSPRRNWSSCFSFSWIPPTSKLVAARISASIEESEIDTCARLWLCTQQDNRNSQRSILKMSIFLWFCNSPNRCHCRARPRRGSHPCALPHRSTLSKSMHRFQLKDNASSCPECRSGSFPICVEHKELFVLGDPCSWKGLELFVGYPAFPKQCKDICPMLIWTS